jgi:hypothetical protein
VILWAAISSAFQRFAPLPRQQSNNRLHTGGDLIGADQGGGFIHLDREHY